MAGKVTRKHDKFISEYLKCFNATQAYMRVYPDCTEDSARAAAARLLATGSVKDEIEARLTEAHMSSNEALRLLAEQARGDIGEVMEIYKTGFNLDMARAKELGLTKLIKKVKQKTTTIIGKKENDDDKEISELEIELYDSQAAIDKILRAHGRYKDTGSEENPAKVVLEIVRKEIPGGTSQPAPETGSLPPEQGKEEGDRSGAAGREDNGS